jgi:hypothetical protein
VLCVWAGLRRFAAGVPFLICFLRRRGPKGPYPPLPRSPVSSLVFQRERHPVAAKKKQSTIHGKREVVLAAKGHHCAPAHNSSHGAATEAAEGAPRRIIGDAADGAAQCTRYLTMKVFPRTSSLIFPRAAPRATSTPTRSTKASHGH